MTFEDIGLSEKLLSAIADSGYTEPTPIQEKAIPYVLMGRDVLGCAQTGTGKTGSFVLPMIDILDEGRAKARMPRSLILAPTRELAAQVGESFERYGKHHKLSKALLIGGSSFSEQLQQLDRGVDVLIATPGRLIDLFERGKILLADVKILVIDEADRMLDMGFIPDVERIVGMLPKGRQTLFFSATMAKEVRRLADKFLDNPKDVSVSRPDSAAKTVTQGLVRCPGTDKRKALQQLLDRDEVASGLIFCNRKRDVSALAKALKKQNRSVGELHGDMAQASRMETLNAFRNDEIELLVCSDVAARGLDIPQVSHVFNYDVPNSPEDYIHRIGRTGRAGRSGIAYMLATPADSKSLAGIEKLIGGAIPPVDVDSVRILPPEKVEGEVIAEVALDSLKIPVDDDSTEAGGDSGGKRRRRGSRRGKKSEPAANGNAAPEATIAHEAAQESETLDSATADTEVSQHDTGADDSASQPEPAAALAQDSEPAPQDEAVQDEAVQDGAQDRQKAANDQGARGKSQPRRSDNSRGRSNDRDKNMSPEKRQSPNGYQSKPFGDHTPAFMLRRVPVSASA